MIVREAINFRDIFFKQEGDSQVNGITIPIIQRDYAQGRKVPQ